MSSNQTNLCTIRCTSIFWMTCVNQRTIQKKNWVRLLEKRAHIEQTEQQHDPHSEPWSSDRVSHAPALGFLMRVVVVVVDEVMQKCYCTFSMNEDIGRVFRDQFHSGKTLSSAVSHSKTIYVAFYKSIWLLPLLRQSNTNFSNNFRKNFSRWFQEKIFPVTCSVYMTWSGLTVWQILPYLSKNFAEFVTKSKSKGFQEY